MKRNSGEKLHLQLEIFMALGINISYITFYFKMLYIPIWKLSVSVSSFSKTLGCLKYKTVISGYVLNLFLLLYICPTQPEPTITNYNHGGSIYNISSLNFEYTVK